MVARLDVETQQFIGLLGEFMPVSKEYIHWVASRLAREERMGNCKARRHKIEFVWLYCGNIDLAQAEAILKYINR